MLLAWLLGLARAEEPARANAPLYTPLPDPLYDPEAAAKTAGLPKATPAATLNMIVGPIKKPSITAMDWFERVVIVAAIVGPVLSVSGIVMIIALSICGQHVVKRKGRKDGKRRRRNREEAAAE